MGSGNELRDYLKDRDSYELSDLANRCGWSCSIGNMGALLYREYSDVRIEVSFLSDGYRIKAYTVFDTVLEEEYSTQEEFYSGVLRAFNLYKFTNQFVWHFSVVKMQVKEILGEKWRLALNTDSVCMFVHKSARLFIESSSSSDEYKVKYQSPDTAQDWVFRSTSLADELPIKLAGVK